MNRSIHTILIILFATTTMVAQNLEEQWDSYISSYEDGNPGSTTLRMDLINVAPLAKLPYVLVTGINYETSREDGFPEDETFQVLHSIGDDLNELITKETEAVLVGSFMYDKKRLEYFYVREANGLKEKIEQFYSQKYPQYEYYLNIKEDKDWDYYREFLYPNEEILNYMADQSVIRSLQKAGDALTKARRVDHWLFFPTSSDMKECREELEKQNYSIESSGKNKETALPYELQIWRIDKVDINSIYPISSKLREIATKYNGQYDGWETSVEKD